MFIGKVLSLPNYVTQYALIADEFGEERSIHGSQLPEGMEEGDDFPYRVKLVNTPSGNDVVSLVHEDE